jgi:alkylation response protein AidB-like acyl-CoA dehydrogenase
MFAEAIESILHDQFTPAAIRAIEEGRDARPAWNVLAEAGFLELLTDEDAGGAGLTLSELFPVVLTIGRHATPVPLAQTIVARALLARAAAKAPAGMITLAQSCRRERDGTLTCEYTPFGALADYVLAGVEGGLVLLDCSAAQRVPSGVYRSQCATLHWPANYRSGMLYGPTAADVQTWGAALHAALIAGAATRVGEMTLEYCQCRSQFGRPIGKYQVIQHQLSVMIEHIAAMTVAAQIAFVGEHLQPARLSVAIGKARASEAVQLVAASAHGLQGAIGITEEYDLQLYSRRLHEWRGAHGAEEYWNGVVGATVVECAGQGVADFVRHAMAS